MTQFYLCCCCFLTCTSLFAQLSDSFTDGNFTADPAWTGDVSNFLVNTTGQLQSNGPTASATIYLSTPNTQCAGKEWQFRLSLQFAPASANHVKIYLMSDQANLEGNLNGYYVRIGEDGTADGVDLYRQQGNTHTKIIDGLPGRAATNPNLRVKAIRDASGNWQLFSDNTGGSTFVPEGTVADNTFGETAYFGIACTHSSTRRQGFFFDDFTIRDAPVVLMNAQAISGTQIKVTFSTAVEETAATGSANYSLNHHPFIQSASLSADRPNEVLLTLKDPLQTDTYTLTINHIKDRNGNTVPANSTASFNYVVPIEYREVVINEIFADESPRVDLPAAEYIELYNPTDRIINLNGCTIADPTAKVTLPDYRLPAGGYVILCKNTFQSEFALFGPTLGLGTFPSLNNAADQLALSNAKGHLIDRVSYADTWYQDETKKEGGWSLEMIDASNYCNEIRNWAASDHLAGGTPGQPNSIAASRPDLTPPQSIQVEPVDSLHLTVYFEEKMDSTTMAQASLYQLTGNVIVQKAEPVGPLFHTVQLSLRGALLPKTVYTLSSQYARDCAGNQNGTVLKASFALPEPADSGDVVINEVLFNPRSGGVDFVELYNRSDKYINLKDWKIANEEEGKPANGKAIAARNYILAPGQYTVVTTNGETLKNQYPKAQDAAFSILPSLPSFPDDAGTVVLVHEREGVADWFNYSEKQHFSLINEQEGVSLERISVNETAANAQNWHSAASTEGYATPGYRNSQTLPMESLAAQFQIEPPVFTPDEDGYRDFTTLQYHFPHRGQVATVTVFDAFGREVRRVASNYLLATEGFLTWDGTNEAGEKVRTGRYIVHISLFTLQGKQEQIKKEVIVGARF